MTSIVATVTSNNEYTDTAIAFLNACENQLGDGWLKDPDWCHTTIVFRSLRYCVSDEGDLEVHDARGNKIAQWLIDPNVLCFYGETVLGRTFTVNANPVRVTHVEKIPFRTIAKYVGIAIAGVLLIAGVCYLFKRG